MPSHVVYFLLNMAYFLLMQTMVPVYLGTPTHTIIRLTCKSYDSPNRDVTIFKSTTWLLALAIQVTSGIFKDALVT